MLKNGIMSVADSGPCIDDKEASNLITLSTGIRTWLDTYKKNSVKPATFDRLETSYRSLLQDNIAHKYQSTLKTSDIQNYVNRMVEDGYALSTIKKQYHLISAYLDYANLEGLIARPIQKGVKLPTQTAVKKSKKEVTGYSKIEQIKLRNVLMKKERIGYAAALLMMETGMRVGECLALTWDDILWERKAISINKTLIRLAHKKQMTVQDSPKSFSSKRTIPLSSTAYTLLEDMCQNAIDLNGYIFAGEDKRPISYEAIRYQIQRACDEAGVPYKGQHAFRHTFATNCYNRGADVKILSKILGHSDVSVTFNVYVHLFGDGLEEMRGIVG